ncbi:glycosyltransferase family 4 protein [Caldinitratiruptor microaerophilus]
MHSYQVNPERVIEIGAGWNIPVPETADGENDLSRYASKRVCFVGRDFVRKGGPLVVAAIRQVRKVDPSVSLVIAGSNLRIKEDGITCLGRVDRTTVRNLFLQSALYVQPSEFEAFGIAFLEAQVTGLPVVGYDMFAMREIIVDGYNGFLLQERRPEVLAELLVSLLSNPTLLRDMGQRGQQLVRERYGWDKVARKMLAHITGH